MKSAGIVNLSETPYDDVSDVLIQGKAGQSRDPNVAAILENLRRRY